jgi:hypothetical protein
MGIVLHFPPTQPDDVVLVFKPLHKPTPDVPRCTGNGQHFFFPVFHGLLNWPSFKLLMKKSGIAVKGFLLLPEFIYPKFKGAPLKTYPVLKKYLPIQLVWSGH